MITAPLGVTGAGLCLSPSLGTQGWLLGLNKSTMKKSARNWNIWAVFNPPHPAPYILWESWTFDPKICLDFVVPSDGTGQGLIGEATEILATECPKSPKMWGVGQGLAELEGRSQGIPKLKSQQPQAHSRSCLRLDEILIIWREKKKKKKKRRRVKKSNCSRKSRLMSKAGWY